MNAPRFSLVVPDEEETEVTQDEEQVSDEEGETEGDVEEEDSEETESTEAGPPDRSIGAILQRVSEQSPEDAEIIRELNRNWERNNQTQAELQRREQQLDSLRSEVSSRLDELESRIGGDDEDAPDPLEDIDPDEIARLERVLRTRGYVRQDDISQRDLEKERGTLVSDLNRQAIEEFGDELGTLGPAGELIVNQTAREKMAPVYERLVVKKALTIPDLHKLANFNELMEAQFEKGRRDGMNTARNENGTMTRRVKKATVATRSSAGSVTDAGLYDSSNPDHVREGIRGFMRRARESLG